MIIIATLIFTIGNNVGFLSLDKQLESRYIVPDNYLLVENDQVEKLGTGFVEANAYKLITDNYNAFKDRDKNLSYIGNPIYFGYYYLCNIKGDGPMEVINTPKSYEVVSETIDNARRNNSIMGSLYYPDQTYYLYNYLVTSGDYVWDNINNKPTIATTLLALTDTPATFTNQGGKLLAVNSSENALVFTDTFSGNIDGGSF